MRRCIALLSSSDASKRALIDRILRVDHAGEYGARRIYEGQLAVLGDKSEAGKAVREMYEQEKRHFDVFEKAVVERRVRPTFLTPFWHVGGYVLGAATAMLGKEAAMACTVAVETEISEHYNNQIRTLLEQCPEEKELLKTLQEFRDDESHHKDVSLQHGAEKAPQYDALVTAVRGMTKLAVYIAERV